MSNEDRQSAIPRVVLAIGAILLFLLVVLLSLRKTTEVVEPVTVPVAPAGGSELVEQLGKDVSRYRDLSEESLRLRSTPVATVMATTDETAEATSGEFPATSDFATSQPIELALLLPPGVLSGWVSDENGLPLPGAAVRLEYEAAVEGGVAPPELTAEADENGTFRIEGIPPGKWSVIGSLEGYGAAALAGIDIQSDREHRPVELRLAPELILKGIVRAADFPVEEAAVSVRHNLTSVGQDGTPRAIPIWFGRTRTTADGTFEIGGLPAVPVTLTVRARDFSPWEKDLQLVPAMEELEVTLEAGGVIAGEVRGSMGEKVTGAVLTLTDPDDAEKVRGTATSGELGKFLFQGLSPRREFDLSAKAENYAPAGPMRVATGATTTVVNLDAGGAIEGTVIDLGTGETLSGITLVAFAAENHRLSLQSKTNGKGKYRIAGLRPGNYTVVVYNLTLTAEPKEGVVVEPEKTTGGVDFSVYTGIRIAGTVVDGESRERLAGAVVELKSQVGPNLLLSRQTTSVTDGAGAFVFENMPQGVYALEAKLDGYTPGLNEEASVRVEALRGITPQPAELKLYRGGTIEGRVSDVHGGPVAGALVQAFHEPGTPSRIDLKPLSTVTDMGGVFRVSNIPVQKEVHLRFSAWKAGLAKGRSGVIVLNMEQNRRLAEVILSQGSSLVVEVADESGNGISDANVSISHTSFPGDPAPPNWTGKTSAMGTLSFPNVPEGKVNGSASREGYISGGASTTLTDGDGATLKIVLKPGNSLAGRVMDDLGKAGGPGGVTARAQKGATGGGSAGVADSGTFRVDTLGEGLFRLDFALNRTTAAGNHQIKWNFPDVAPNGGNGELLFTVPCNASLEGRVIAAELDEPLKSFTITAEGSYTDDAGNGQKFKKSHSFGDGSSFRFDKLPPGEYNVTVSAKDYLPVTRTGIAVESPGLYSVGTLKLNPGGACKFRTVDELTGEAIGGLTGTLKPDGPSARTNATGLATINPATPGLYTLELRHNDYLPRDIPIVKVSRGKEIDLGELTLRPGGVIFGSVVDGANEPIRGLTVEAQSVVVDQLKTAATDAAGKYNIRGLHPGGIVLTFRGKVNGRSVAKSFDLSVSAGEKHEQDVTLWANSRLTISLIGSATAEVNRSLVNLYPLRADRRPLLSDTIRATHLSGNRFVAEYLSEGTYLVTVAAPTRGGSTLRWAELARVGERDSAVVVAAGSMRFGGQILASAEGEAVAGQEVSMELLSAPQSSVSALSDWWQFAVECDDNGFFKFENLPEGTYSLVANNKELKADILEIVELSAVSPIPVQVYFFK